MGAGLHASFGRFAGIGTGVSRPTLMTSFKLVRRGADRPIMDKVDTASWGELVLEMAAFVIGGLVIALMLTTTMLGGVRHPEREPQKEPSKGQVVERPSDRPRHDGAKTNSPD